MTSLKELDIKEGYDSDYDDIIKSFYIPCLSISKKYFRLTGFFSSNSIKLAAKGVRNLIKNGGTMRLVTGVQFNPADKKAIEEHVLEPEHAINNKLIEELEKFMESDYSLQSAKLFGWMLRHNILEIKIADLTGIGIYHPKVGIFFDDTKEGDLKNSISFSGSNNETAGGWLYDIEEFKVFKLWEDVQSRYYEKDIQLFNRFWYGRTKRCKIYDLPDAFKKHLIKIAPESYEEIYLGFDDGLETQIKTSTKKLWPHQELAILAWSNPSNWKEDLASNLSQYLQNQEHEQPETKNRQFQGIFSMATGSGKTFTAIKASLLAQKNVITLIAMPLTIMSQWEDEIRECEPSAKIIFAGGADTNWRNQLPTHLAPYRLGNPPEHTSRLFILCTYDTIGSESFVQSFNGIDSKFVQFIGDEVHNIGNDASNAFNIKADRVLGLSATHTRHFDDPGTTALVSYFGDPVYEFTLKDGIREGFLCHYNYHPYFVDLTNEEQDAYSIASQKIGIIQTKLSQARGNRSLQGDLMNNLTIALNERKKIIRKASNKPSVIDTILERNFSGTNEKTIIFCEDTEQEKEIMSILRKQNKIYYEYSSKRSPQEKNVALKEFQKTGHSRFLLGINCLDEGLDVPESDKCLIVASTTNPRQFIQRRGRVLRKSNTNSDKIAEVYDTVVLPQINNPIGRTLTEAEERTLTSRIRIIQGEFNRVKLMSDGAYNHDKIKSILKQTVEDLGIADRINL